MTGLVVEKTAWSVTSAVDAPIVLIETALRAVLCTRRRFTCDLAIQPAKYANSPIN